MELDKAIDQIVVGLTYDGAHHKQDQLCLALISLVGEERYRELKKFYGWEDVTDE